MWPPKMTHCGGGGDYRGVLVHNDSVKILSKFNNSNNNQRFISKVIITICNVSNKDKQWQAMTSMSAWNVIKLSETWGVVKVLGGSHPPPHHQCLTKNSCVVALQVDHLASCRPVVWIYIWVPGGGCNSYLILIDYITPLLIIVFQFSSCQ